MKTRQKADIRDVVAEAMTWPTIRETATEWRLPDRFVRSVVERGKVEAIHLDHIRVNPASFQTYMEKAYRQGQY